VCPAVVPICGGTTAGSPVTGCPKTNPSAPVPGPAAAAAAVGCGGYATACVGYGPTGYGA
jgi:hypothetical protein